MNSFILIKSKLQSNWFYYPHFMGLDSPEVKYFAQGHSQYEENMRFEPNNPTVELKLLSIMCYSLS